MVELALIPSEWDECSECMPPEPSILTGQITGCASEGNGMAQTHNTYSETILFNIQSLVFKVNGIFSSVSINL